MPRFSIPHVWNVEAGYVIVPAVRCRAQRKVLVQKVAEHLQQRPELLPTLLTTLFEIVLFEDCPNQWSLSRPMLSLILINEQVGS